MPEQANGGGIRITLEGSHLRVDARPARLVSQLLGSGSDPIVTAHAVDGAAHTQSLPGHARQATFRIRDDVTVEATRAADFVAIAEDSGRCLVVALRGEVTVVPRGNDRFALGAHEALVVPAGEGNPRVVATDSLTEADRAEVDAVLDATVDAVFAAPPPAAEPQAAAEPAPEVAPEPKPEPAQPVTEAVPATAAATAAAATPVKKGQAKRSPAKAAGQRKKGKKGRPQPGRPQKAAAAKKASPAKAAATTVPAAAVAAGGGTPTKPPSKGGGGGGGGGGGRDDDSYEDTPRDRRLVGLLVVGALGVIVALIFVLSGGGDDDETPLATDATTTTTEAEPEATTTTAAEPAATTTTAAPATTTTARATTTTTARATTTTAAPAPPNYSIEPKSCVQNGSSITWTAAITNNAEEAYDFKVTVQFKDAAGKEIGTAEGSVTNLASKRTADISATARNVTGSPASCKVTNVEPTTSD